MTEVGIGLKKTPVAVRHATEADVGSLVALMHDFYAEAGYALDHDLASASFRSILNNASLGSVFLALVGEQPIGHAVLAVRFTMEHYGLSGYIDDLYVAPAFRRLGAGAALVDALVAQCRRLACMSVQVEVAPTNSAALALYERFGLAPSQGDRALLTRVLQR